MFKKQRRSSAHKHKNGEFWQSYSDMMAALLLMFILIMGATIYQSLHTYEEKNEELEEQQEVIDTQQAALDETTEQLEDLEQMVGVKEEIIETLSEAFAESDLSVQVDANTGDITFDSSILFDYDASELSEEGMAFLDEFIPMYISVLLSDEYIDYVSEIIIEGHTDSQGTYMYNLNLSQARAYSVAAYCLDETTSVLTPEQLTLLRGIVTANGRSYSDPVYQENGSEDMGASRRVVFKFGVKDDEMIAEMESILGLSQ